MFFAYGMNMGGAENLHKCVLCICPDLLLLGYLCCSQIQLVNGKGKTFRLIISLVCALKQLLVK